MTSSVIAPSSFINSTGLSGIAFDKVSSTLLMTCESIRLQGQKGCSAGPGRKGVEVGLEDCNLSLSPGQAIEF
jgi:hypothetical protein